MLEDHSLGSMLMVQPGLPRHPDGQPHQVILLLSDEGQVVGLATDTAGRVLGWPNRPYEGDDGEELLADLLRRVQPVPPDVAFAARAWWESEGRPETGSCQVAS
jgi:hypothetical protein